MSVSIFIQTLNEEENLPGCLESVSWADDVVVLDSYSKDKTEQICRERGCRFFQRKYDGRGPHQSWAMRNIQWKNPWIFYLDADERMTPELREEIERISTDPVEQRVAFYCGRKNYFMDRWIKYSMPPGHIMRFFRPDKIRFERLANPVPVIEGPHGYLKNYFLHYNLSKGFAEWFERHNRYSTYEAIEEVKALQDRSVRLVSLFSSDPSTRRRELKKLSSVLPMRSPLKFIYMYFLRLGLLDGRAGLTYCILQTMYEYQIAIKARELRAARKKDGRAAISGPLSRPVVAVPAVVPTPIEPAPTPTEVPAPRPVPAARPRPTIPPVLNGVPVTAAAPAAVGGAGVDLSHNPSPHSLRNRVGRVLWALVYITLFRTSLPPLHRWRVFLLRCFGARVSWKARPYPRCRVWAPWNLVMDDYATMADDVDCYCVDTIHLGPHCTVSQYTYLCGATHNFEHPRFPVVPKPITIGAQCWLAADVFIAPGVTVGEGAVVGARACVFGDLPPWTVSVGSPARPIRMRVMGGRKGPPPDGPGKKMAGAPVVAGASEPTDPPSKGAATPQPVAP